ncbi:MAG: sugar-binding transcriptional regulator [Verrucomicrobia bacterium]|nr:sugar-binding transcriptional regulator [Verrucomicrobiota bacterium]MBV8640724.1 sugar-binding transcriptional regulator [Verrucomicrobiota bacterium]
MDPSSPKQEEKMEIAVRAAWLYHVAGNTQHEIARKLQISRPTAQRLVAFALERGLVKVRVNHKVASCLELAIALRQRYDLVVCDVVPVNADSPDQVLRKIAVAAAQVMESYLNEIQPKIIALGSGQTIKAVIGELNALARPQHRLLSLVGTIARDGSSNPYDAALQAAEKIGSKCFLIPAPLLADSPEERRQWCNHRLYKIVEELSNQADVAFVGIGDMGVGCPMHRDGFLTREEVMELVKAGAVGDNLGWAFSEAGELVRASSQQRVTSIQLRRPPKMPVIAFAGGERKARAVLGALRGQWINGLVTDETCARIILADKSGQEKIA